MPGRGGRARGLIDQHMGPRPWPRPRRQRHRPWRTCACTRDRMNSTVPGGCHSRRPADEPSNALFAPPPIRRPGFSTDNRAVAACSALPAAPARTPYRVAFVSSVFSVGRTRRRRGPTTASVNSTQAGDRVTRTRTAYQQRTCAPTMRPVLSPSCRPCNYPGLCAWLAAGPPRHHHAVKGTHTHIPEL